MAHYYQIPKTKRNPRVIHLIDIPAMLLILVLTLRLLPIGSTVDFSAGFNEKSDGYLQAERQLLLQQYEEGYATSAHFEKLFNTSTLQSGGYVYDLANGLYQYHNGASGMGYYTRESGDEELIRPCEDPGDHPRGLILAGVDSCVNVSLTEEGQVFFSDLEKRAGLIDAWVDLEEEPDLAWAAAAIVNDEIPYCDAARLWSLVERDILIGFDGHRAWFQTVSDGVHHIHRGDAQGVETVHSIRGDLQDVMVIEGQYLVYGLEGDLYIRCLETGKENHIACTDMEGVGPLRQITYRVHTYGTIRIYTLNEASGIYFDLSKTGAETGQMSQMTGLDFTAFSGMYVTGTKDTVNLWFRGADGYTHVTREG